MTLRVVRRSTLDRCIRRESVEPSGTVRSQKSKDVGNTLAHGHISSKIRPLLISRKITPRSRFAFTVERERFIAARRFSVKLRRFYQPFFEELRCTATR